MISIIGLFVTLVFSTFGACQGLRQQKKASETERIGLLTQLNSNATDTERAINATTATEHECDPHPHLKDRTREEPALYAALDYYEYLAWLFNHQRLNVEDSRRFFSPRMIDGWRLARRYLGGDEVRHEYVELEKFVGDSTKRSPDPCKPS
jgi:hypothetical protein